MIEKVVATKAFKSLDQFNQGVAAAELGLKQAAEACVDDRQRHFYLGIATTLVAHSEMIAIAQRVIAHERAAKN